MEYLFERVCVSVSHRRGQPARAGVSLVSSFWEVCHGAVAFCVRVTCAGSFTLLSCRVKSFTDTHSYSLLVGPRNNKPEVLQYHMSPRTRPIENRRTEGTENKCELNKQIAVNVSPIKTCMTFRSWGVQ